MGTKGARAAKGASGTKVASGAGGASGTKGATGTKGARGAVGTRSVGGARSQIETDSGAARRDRAVAIMDALRREYPDADCTLDYADPFELLVCAILAAQCTDKRVNVVAPPLFKKRGGVSGFAKADVAELQEEIRAVGMHRTKARSIVGCASAIVERHGGKVPEDMASLLALPGVGRKIANLVLGDAFGVPGVVVDTHAGRLARRMGLSESNKSEEVERDLMEALPMELWISSGHLFVAHGRAVCKAMGPFCGACAIAKAGLCQQAGIGEVRE